LRLPWSKVSGRAPYLSWLASSVAVSLLNVPVICDWLLSTPWIAGADTIWLSSTTATMQTCCWDADVFWLGWVALQVPPVLLYASLVRSLHLLVPAPLNVRSTFQVEPFWSRLACAPDRSVPSTFALSIRYLVCWPVSHATAPTFGSTIEPVGRSFSLSQVICGTLNCSVGGSSATCCAVSFRNGSSWAIVAWSSDFGSVIWVAAEAASWPIVSRMACCCSARLGPEAPGDGLPVAAAAAGLVAGGVVAGGVVAAAVGLAPGE